MDNNGRQWRRGAKNCKVVRKRTSGVLVSAGCPGQNSIIENVQNGPACQKQGVIIKVSNESFFQAGLCELADCVPHL